MKMESDFMRMQREATEQIRQMNARAKPPVLEEKKQKKELENQKQNEAPDGDMLILLFLLFLLYKDGADPILMLALLYLLM